VSRQHAGSDPKARKGVPAKLGSMKNPPMVAVVSTTGGKVSMEEMCEVWPSGMLVQKRGGIKMKHAGITQEIYISLEVCFVHFTSMSPKLLRSLVISITSD
jgi:hypothetical protein